MNQKCNSQKEKETKKEITMHSRCFHAIWKLLQQGRPLDKYTASSTCHCDQRTAQRILSFLHLEQHIKISDWIKVGNSQVRIPVYTLIEDADSDSPADMPKPLAVTADMSEYKKQRRKDPDIRDREAHQKRNKRAVAKAKQQFETNVGSMWKLLLGTGD